MRIGSLFSGAGALDVAVTEVFGGTVAWHCEKDEAASVVLAARFPGVPNLGDITAVDWTAVEPVDVLCGGFPCQDVSAAGRREGLHAGTRSGLWARYVDAIDALQPHTVVVENVKGLLSAKTDVDGVKAIDVVLADLTDLGYGVRWAVVPACAVGAPHRRDRVFLLARRCDDGVSATTTRLDRKYTYGDLLPTPSARDYKGRDLNVREGGQGLPEAVLTSLLPTPRATDGSKGGPNQRGSSGDLMLPSTVVRLPGQPLDPTALLPTPNASDGTGGGMHPDRRIGHSHQIIDAVLLHADPQRWGKYMPAIERWEELTRPAPSPTEPTINGNLRLSAKFSEWMMGWPKGWVTDLIDPNAARRGGRGRAPGTISNREAMTIIGNGVVAHQAAAAIRCAA